MWPVIFFIGFPIFLYRAIKDPIYAVAAASYVYFAIPTVEFGVPGMPYQAMFFALGFLGAFRYYLMFHGWGAEEILALGKRVAKSAMEAVKAEVKEAIAVATLQDRLKGEIRRAGIEAGETKALEVVRADAPAVIHVPVRRAVQTVLTQAADQAEQEALKVAGLPALKTKGAVRGALEERALKLVDQTIDERLDKEVEQNINEAIKSDEKTDRGNDKGPLGIPLPNGPLRGLMLNTGFWLHVIFIGLTYYGAQNAIYDKNAAASKVMTTLLLMIPILSIILAVRTPRHFFIFVFAWMFGTWHICMNGVHYWLQYGGRADNAGGQGGESNFLAAIIVTVAPVAFGLAVNLKNTVYRLAFLGAAACYALGVLASGSRAGLLALIGAMGYWTINTNRKLIALGLAMLATSGFLVAAPESFWEKMGTILGEKDKNPYVRTAVEPSKGERLVLWDLAKKIWREHPITGIGPANYTVVSAEETDFTDPYKGQKGLQAHNSWLQIAAEYGTVGLVVWAGSFLWSFTCYFRARRRLRNYPGWEWFPAICLGMEAGAIASAVMLSFNSFMWYDYIYWHMITGPLALEIAKKTAERLEWLKPKEAVEVRPPPRYGPPQKDGLDLGAIDVSAAAPIRPA